MGNLLLPVGETRTSSWGAHQRRGTPSTEPGTDFFCPIGTPIHAADDGWISGTGNSIIPATGKWVAINMDNGMRVRYLHIVERLVPDGARVRRGDVIALSGATGYGEEDWSWNVAGTGGAHVHTTLWPDYVQRFGYRSNGTPWTVDFMDYVGGEQTAGDGAQPFPETPKEWDEMATEEQIEAAFRRVATELVATVKTPDVKIAGVVGGKMYLTGPGGVVHVTNPGDLALLRRHIAATAGGEETFTQRQLDTIASYLRRIA